MAIKYLIDEVSEETKARIHPSTIRLLEKTKVPRHAYVVVEVPKFTARRAPNGGKYERDFEKKGLCFLNVEDQPDQRTYLNHLAVKRGCKVVTFGNFPSHESSVKQVRDKYRLYNNPDGTNPWDNLKDACNAYIQNAPVGAEERKAYSEELEARKKEIEDLKALVKKEATNEHEGKNRKSASASKSASKAENESKDSGTTKQLGSAA